MAGALGGARTAAQSVQILTADIEHWQEASFGPWVFFEARSGVFVGRGGLRRCKLAGVDSVEVLYAVRSDAWGDGYASEMAALALAEARRLGLQRSSASPPPRTGRRGACSKRSASTLSDSFQYAAIPHLIGRLSITGASRR